MTISASTESCSDWMPCSAWSARSLPSKPKGRVTTPTVSAPSHASDLGDDGRAARACPAAPARRHEDHVWLL